jgi:hypothetical protein
MLADAICNEKQCYVFSVDQRYFTYYYSLHLVIKKIFSEDDAKKKIIIFYPNIRAVFFSPRTYR